jgi:hypothetical protein
MSKNDITGDSLVNKPLSKQGEENWDRIFGKKSKGKLTDMLIGFGEDAFTDNKEHNKEKKISRIDTIGQNGNDGDHYEYELNKSTGDVEKRFIDGVSKPNGEQFDE